MQYTTDAFPTEKELILTVTTIIIAILFIFPLMFKTDIFHIM